METEGKGRDRTHGGRTGEMSWCVLGCNNGHRVGRNKRDGENMKRNWKKK